MTLVAGVDSSTQSCKVVVCDLDTGTVVRSGRAPHPDGTEVNPEHWWQALLAAIDDVGGLDDVGAVSVAAQQHGLVALDAAGDVIRPALLWNDTRSAKAARELRDEIGDAELAARTGSVPVASYTITKLRWLADTEPKNARRVAAVALPHDWLTWRLRGFGPERPDLGELSTDRSDASGTSYFDPVANEYDRELLAHALRAPSEGIVLPTVLSAAESRTVIHGLPSFGTGLVVGAGAGDNAAAALGLGATVGDIVVSIGTSGTVFAVTDTPVRDATGTVSGFADATGNYLPLIATLNAARTLDAIADLLGVTHDELGDLALAAKPGSAGVVLVPYFEGERTPNLPDSTASLHGMTLASTTRENLARAAIEGMLCGLADGLDALRRTGVTVGRILLIGGAAHNPAVTQIAAHVFKEPVSAPKPAEYVAVGAAAQAAWALTGTRPRWVSEHSVAPPPNHRPEVRENYARYAAQRLTQP